MVVPAQLLLSLATAMRRSFKPLPTKLGKSATFTHNPTQRHQLKSLPMLYWRVIHMALKKLSLLAVAVKLLSPL
ncbi:hypothetical protein FOXG_17616 [Fusarium oxysporum f. sp. lycopersici 4287]|uniref:Uncharacterized protein n=1 Tax=Fusarium oxysporum f. sp. lycopersici (strain 4287 / CBS 123668 / FGSC 9935 / NRRL 34936) TaxID=426428 RepID=A0A0J9WB92_FUSO4|nr:uncharacterized protein FOXG_17616 [Fusarium oxysporum f. sp. lycopersici 4287]KNB20649.1 hypothetical protein FOXG_17616 [Fusarium oxysporum f. sp. lycopersici 4287]